MKTTHLILTTAISLFAFGAWVGIAWGLGWILEAALSVEVNLKIFTIAGIVLGSVAGGFVFLTGLLQNFIFKKIED